MQVDRYKHFKWTPRTAWLSIIFAVVIGVIDFLFKNGMQSFYDLFR